MGEIAEDMLDGMQCSLCGICFEQPHGYPVACRDCWTKDCGYQKAYIKEL